MDIKDLVVVVVENGGMHEAMVNYVEWGKN